ncbi:MAG: hypothetical protein WC852_07030 [Candidatus Nanoarchaeia archaeon]|jgi:hypothetical protein
MKLPKNVRVFETREEAAKWLEPYAQANMQTINRFVQIMQSEWVKTLLNEKAKKAISRLEVICSIELIAVEWDKETIYFPSQEEQKRSNGYLGGRPVEEGYATIEELANTLKKEISRGNYAGLLKMAPSFYTLVGERQPPFDKGRGLSKAERQEFTKTFFTGL